MSTEEELALPKEQLNVVNTDDRPAPDVEPPRRNIIGPHKPEEFRVPKILVMDGGLTWKLSKSLVCNGHEGYILHEDETLVKPGDVFDNHESFRIYVDSHAKKWLHYYRISYSAAKHKELYSYQCVYAAGSNTYKSKSKGLRKRAESLKTNCPGRILLSRVPKSAPYLTVTYVCNHHDHPLSEEKFLQLQHGRRLDPEIKEEIKDLLYLKVKPAIVSKYIQEKTGLLMNLRWFFNLTFTMKKTNMKRNFSPEKLKMLNKKIEHLRSKYKNEEADDFQSDSPDTEQDGLNHSEEAEQQPQPQIHIEDVELQGTPCDNKESRLENCLKQLSYDKETLQNVKRLQESVRIDRNPASTKSHNKQLGSSNRTTFSTKNRHKFRRVFEKDKIQPDNNHVYHNYNVYFDKDGNEMADYDINSETNKLEVEQTDDDKKNDVSKTKIDKQFNYIEANINGKAGYITQGVTDDGSVIDLFIDSENGQQYVLPNINLLELTQVDEITENSNIEASADGVNIQNMEISHECEVAESIASNSETTDIVNIQVYDENKKNQRSGTVHEIVIIESCDKLDKDDENQNMSKANLYTVHNNIDQTNINHYEQQKSFLSYLQKLAVNKNLAISDILKNIHNGYAHIELLNNISTNNTKNLKSINIRYILYDKCTSTEICTDNSNMPSSPIKRITNQDKANKTIHLLKTQIEKCNKEKESMKSIYGDLVSKCQTLKNENDNLTKRNKILEETTTSLRKSYKELLPVHKALQESNTNLETKLKAANDELKECIIKKNMSSSISKQDQDVLILKNKELQDMNKVLESKLSVTKKGLKEFKEIFMYLEKTSIELKKKNDKLSVQNKALEDSSNIHKSKLHDILEQTKQCMDAKVDLEKAYLELQNKYDVITTENKTYKEANASLVNKLNQTQKDHCLLNEKYENLLSRLKRFEDANVMENNHLIKKSNKTMKRNIGKVENDPLKIKKKIKTVYQLQCPEKVNKDINLKSNNEERKVVCITDTEVKTISDDESSKVDSSKTEDVVKEIEANTNIS